MADERKILFFDGTCALCCSIIRFLIQKNIQELYFSPLKSAFAQDYLQSYGVNASKESSVYLTSNGNVYSASVAVLLVLSMLGTPYYQIAKVLQLVPPWLRDKLYYIVARNRRRWFGKSHCGLPGSMEQKHILQ